MSKKQSREKNRPHVVISRRNRMVAAIILALICAVGTSMLAQVNSRRKGQGASGEVSVAGFTPGSPSKEMIYGAGGKLLAVEEPCLSDTQPPTFPTCPAINVAAAFQCPYGTSAQVNYANPVATDNCAIMTVACNPASGSTFNVGASSVTCMATDTSGNTATCSFVVNVFSACLVDDANPGNVVLFNASTGDYRFCRNGVVVATGRSTPIVSGCSVTIDNVKGNRHVNISVTGAGSGSGAASFQKGAATICQISDSSLTGNACACQ